jgi:hypothetical protein
MADAAFGTSMGSHLGELYKSQSPDAIEATPAQNEWVKLAWGGPETGKPLLLASNDQPVTVAAATEKAWVKPELRTPPDGPPGVLSSLDGIPFSEVTVQGTVAKILPDNPNGLQHEQFLVALPDGKDIFVAHDLTMAPRVPLTVGESIEMKGEWIPEPETHGGVSTIGVVHWTHHTDTPQHESGWIQAGGQTYQ